MRPYKGLKRFKLEARYPHKRSEGITRRKNSGSFLQSERKK